jgi:thioesterase domain-containing protein
MARDYVEEIRQVQPHGPYYLGGFSGGGIAAYEISRQLEAAGEEVALIVMLDTPIPSDPPLTKRDRLAIQRQKFQREGIGYVWKWVENRYRWQQELKAKAEQVAEQAQESSGHDFHSQVIEAAFYRALGRYDLQPSDLDVVLFRPRLKPAFQLAPGRAINADQRLIHFDNGWAPFVRSVDVHEVPGDHDSMVLEPNVRVLARQLRESIEVAEKKAAELGQTGKVAQTSKKSASNRPRASA